MIVGRDEQVDGHYIGMRLTALVIPAGAHYVVDSFADGLACIADIEARLARGDRP